MVWNSLVDSDGSEGPTTFTAINRNLYVVKGIKLFTLRVVASGLDSSYMGNQDTFLRV